MYAIIEKLKKLIMEIVMNNPVIKISNKTIKRLVNSFTEEKVNKDFEEFIKGFNKYESNQFHINTQLNSYKKELESVAESYKKKLIEEIKENNEIKIKEEVENHILHYYSRLEKILSTEHSFSIVNYRGLTNSGILRFVVLEKIFEITIMLDEEKYFIFEFSLNNNKVDLNDYKLVVPHNITKNIKEVFELNKELFKSIWKTSDLESIFNMAKLTEHYTEQLGKNRNPKEKTAIGSQLYKEFYNFLLTKNYTKSEYEKLYKDTLEFIDYCSLNHDFNLIPFEKIDIT